MNDRTQIALVLVAAIIVGMNPKFAIAQSNLDTMKALAQGAKALQDRLNQAWPRQNSAQHALPSPAGVISSLEMPEKSEAHPDVVGLILGITTLDEARQIFGKYQPKLKVQEGFTLSRVRPYIGKLYGYAGNYDYLRYRHVLSAKLASPAAGSRVIAVQRALSYAVDDSPALTNMQDALKKKYGEQMYVHKIGPSRAGITEFRIAWAWAADGQPVTLTDGHPCADPQVVTPLAGEIDHAREEQSAKPALNAGCAAVVYAFLTVQNDVVTAMNLQAIDVVGVARSARLTTQAEAAAVAEQAQRQREKALQRSAPSL